MKNRCHCKVEFLPTMLLPLIALSVLGGALAQVPGVNKCPDITTDSHFNVTKFLGRWYEAEKFFVIFEAFGKCITADYTAGQNGTMNMVNRQISTVTRGSSSVGGIVYTPDASQPGKLKALLNIGLFHPETDFWVLGTDYQKYAIIYTCVNLHLANLQFAWILTRERNPPDSVITQARTVAASQGLDTSRFMKTDQKDC
ncbi:apolipoprotein D-like [Venturia canescens]|uniref:apolipoprotein D-like n=1 Tax=Venturia canescens TaxID=32260 RepID=UPI001C9BEB61|nr:apolipoprotein D-like [Venturia canescens]